MQIQQRIEFNSKPKPLTATETTLVRDAVDRMSEMKFGSIVATGADGKMSGLFTERDLLNRVVARGLDPEKTQLKDVMTTQL